MAKSKKQAHLHYGESISEYAKKCGAIATQKIVVPSGLDLTDIPFRFSRVGLRADYTTSVCDDWRIDKLKLQNAVVRACWYRDKAQRVLSDDMPYNMPWSLYRLRIAQTALTQARKALQDYNRECYRLYQRQLRTPADAWSLVNPASVKSWLALVAELGTDAVDGANISDSPFATYGEAFARMTEYERQKLATARDDIKMQLIKEKETKHGHQKKRYNHFVVVSGDLSKLPITSTGKAVLTEYALRIASGAVSRVYAASGSPFLLNLKNQYVQVRKRFDAYDRLTDSLIGGPYMLTSSKSGKDIEDGKGGRRYKVDFKLSEIKGKIMYKEKKHKNSYGAFVSEYHYALTKDAEEEVKLATDAVVSSTLTDFDAVVNSVFCPADGDIKNSFLYRVSLACDSFSDIWDIFRKYGFSGAMAQIDLMRSDYSQSKTKYISVVSISDLLHDVQGADGVPDSFIDTMLYIWDGIKSMFPSCRGGRSDKYKQVFFRMCSDLSTDEISQLTGIPVRTVRYYCNRIRTAVSVFVFGKRFKLIAG